MATGKLKINPFKNVPDIAKLASGSEALKLFYAELSTDNIGNELLTTYEQRVVEDNARLHRTFVQGKAEGLVEGLAEGLVEGQKMATFRMVKSLKDQQFEPSAIATATGLSLEEIERI